MAWTLPTILVPMAFSVPFFLGRVFLFRDILHFVIPAQVFAARELAAGHLPEWNPLLYGGAPFLAEPGSGVFYPPNWVFLFLAPARAATLFVLLHLPLAGGGAFRLARQLDCSAKASAVAGVVYATSGYLLSMHGGHYYFAGAAWLPMTMALLLEATAAVRIRALVLGLSAVGMMVFNGEFQSLAFAVISTISLALARKPRSLRNLGAFVGAVAGGIGLGAVQLVPTLFLARESARASGLTFEGATLWSLHPGRWLELVAPLPFGISYPDNSQWNTALLNGIHAVPWAPSLYLGPAALLLAAVAALRQRSATTWVIAGGSIGALLLAAGPSLPLFRVWWMIIPGARFFRYPEKYVVVTELGVALLAAIAVSAWERERFVPRWVAILAGSLGLSLIVAALGVWAGRAPVSSRIAQGLAQASANVDVEAAFANLVTSLSHAAAVALVLGLLVLIGRRIGTASIVGLIAVMTFDGVLVGFRALSYGDGSFMDTPPRLLSELRERVVAGAAGRFLRDRSCVYSGDGDGATLLERIRAFEWKTGQENFLMLFGFADALGYSAALPADKLKAWGVATQGGFLRAGRLFGASVLIRCAPGESTPGIVPVDDPLPRVFVVPSTRSVEPADSLAILGEPSFNPERAAVVEGPASSQSTGAGSAALFRESNTEVEVHTSGGGGTLVLADSFSPGWSVSVDALKAPLLRADGIYRAVSIPPGDHVVKFRYQTPGLVYGAILTALSLAGVALGIALSRKLR
jgi:hypothetical protein